MSREQIEEMARVLDTEYDCVIPCSDCHFSVYKNCADMKSATKLYAAGYRKQSEGKWERRIFIIFDSEKVGYRCSECNTTWDTQTLYCPNCGAKMKGGAE